MVTTIRFREYDDDSSPNAIEDGKETPTKKANSELPASISCGNQSNRQYRECVLFPDHTHDAAAMTNAATNADAKENILDSLKLKENEGNSKDEGNKNVRTEDKKRVKSQNLSPVFLSWKTVHGRNYDNEGFDSYIDSYANTKLADKINLQSLIEIVRNIQYKTKQVLKDLFLPIGYPNTVHEGYIQYQFYDSVQGLCSYLRGVVSTSAVLTAAGVGDSEATAMSAAVHWATKDGCGMIGGLLFSYYSSSYFDAHIKEFRLFADIINDVGLTLDMFAPHIPKAYLLYVSILATICRSLCGIAAGATKGSITEHFSKHNMADLNAKEGTQETLVSLIGMIFGILLAQMIQKMEEQCTLLEGKSLYSYSAVIATWSVFLVLTFIHVWANYIGVKTLRLRTLNRQRAEDVLGHIIQKVTKLVEEDMSKAKSDTIAIKMELAGFNEKATILPPSKCNESLWKSVQKMLLPGQVRLGVKLSSCLKQMTREEIQSLIGKNLFQNEKYLLMLNNSKGSTMVTKIDVVLHLGATEKDKLKAFIHALVLKEYIQSHFVANDLDSRIKLITRTKNCVDNLIFMNTLSLERVVTCGWDSKLLLGFGRWRATWIDKKADEKKTK